MGIKHFYRAFASGDNRRRVIVVVGPTASGKSKLAEKLAKKFQGEIIAADSRTVYKGMDIGTAKNFKDHLVDLISPNKQFTAGEFKKLALDKIRAIWLKNKVPLLVGGTGFYIDVLTKNLLLPKTPLNTKLRQKLNRMSLKKLQTELRRLDPQAEKIVDLKNPRRLIRAIEICKQSKKPLSETRKIGAPLFDFLKIGIELPREKLYQKINKRVEKMFKVGLLQEAKRIYQKYGEKAPGLNCIGYREFVPYFQKKIDLKRTKEIIQQNTRHYAKRQLTWFKKDQTINWVKNYQTAEKLTKKFLTRS